MTLALNFDALFRLNRLMQTLRQAATGHGATRVFINEYNLALLHDVLHIALEQYMGSQARVDMME